MNLAESFCFERCPFLRNINEDGPDFDMAFGLFHGRDGVVPLSGRASTQECPVESAQVPQFNPLAAKAATISLSSFGGAPFGFDLFSNKLKKSKQNKKSSKQEPSSQKGGNSSHEATSNEWLKTGQCPIGNSSHEATSNEWLKTGQCPIAKSFRAVRGVLPLVAKVLQPPPGVKFICPPAVVAARAALARTALVKNLRPQPLPVKMLAIALLGMAANVPLGIWREHTQKFSPQWFAAIHAAVPFIAMLQKSVLMPKTAMDFTLAASILGQTIGSRAEKMRLKALAAERSSAAPVRQAVVSTANSGQCSEEKALPFKGTGSELSTEAPTTKGKYMFLMNIGLINVVSL